MEMKCFPITYQFDTMQCGIACLQMICKYYGRDYSLSYLSGICTSSAEGVSLHGINETAIQLGFHTLCARLDIKDTMEMPLPCILHWNQNHFVVLYNVKKGTSFMSETQAKD